MSINYAKELSKNIIAGLMIGLMMAISSVSFSAFIYNGDLSQYLLVGATASLIGTAIIAIILAIGSTSKIIIGEPQDIFAVIFALIAPSIATTVAKSSTTDVLPTLIATTMVMAIFLGLSMYLIGLLRMGKLVRYIPFSVIGGFLAGTGWLILSGTFAVLTPFELLPQHIQALFSATFLHLWLWPFLYGMIMLLVLRYFSHFLVFPFLLILGLMLFYSYLFINGISFEKALANGWMMGPFPEGKLATIPTLKLFSANVHWLVILEYLPDYLTLSLIGAISILLNISSFEISTKTDFEINNELKVTGFANILTGLFGGLGGYHSLSTSKINFKFGITSRFVGILTGIVSVIILFLGTPILTLLPKFVFGGLLFYIALDFLVEWLVDARPKLSLVNYIIIIIIAVTIATLGLLTGLMVGLTLSLLLFFIQYSRIDVIRVIVNAKIMPSNVDRSQREQQILKLKGEQVLIPIISGYLFFGNASHIIQAIVNACAKEKANPVRYIVIDFSRITGFEASCITSVIKLLQYTKSHEIEVVFANLPKRTEKDLHRFFESEGDYYTFEKFDKMELAIEWCEDQLIKDETDELNNSSRHVLENVFTKVDDVRTLLNYFERVEFSKDHVLIKQGDDTQDLYVLTEGSLSVVLQYGQRDEVRLRKIRNGTIIGEMSLYNQEMRSATIVTENDCVLYKLTAANFNRLRDEEPGLAKGLDLSIISHLSNRLKQVNQFVNFIKSKILSSKD